MITIQQGEIMTVKELIKYFLDHDEISMDDEIVLSIHTLAGEHEDPDIYHKKLEEDDLAPDCGKMNELVIFADTNEAKLQDYQ